MTWHVGPLETKLVVLSQGGGHFSVSCWGFGVDSPLYSLRQSFFRSVFLHFDMPGFHGRNWVFTLNNYTEEECADLLSKDVRYICFGKELAPTTGTPHLQGYVQLRRKSRLGAVKRFLGIERIHLEGSRGTPTQAIEYSRKEGDFHESGEPNRAGARHDLMEVKSAIDDGKSDMEIAELYFASWCRHRNAFKEYRLMKQSRSQRNIKILIYWGPTGLGKTRRVAEEFPDAYWKPKGEWFDGYSGEKVIVLDEFYSWLSYDLTLRLCDRYQVKLPVKGSFVPCCAETIVFTSNKDPREWWPNVQDKSPWERRLREFGTIVHFDSL